MTTQELYALVHLYMRESRYIASEIERHDGAVVDLIELVLDAWRDKRRVFVCANGGGAGYAANLCADLNLHAFATDNKQAARRREGFEAVNLCADPAVLTALMNDRGADRVFADQIVAAGRARDVLVAMSGSGTSPNIVAALAAARVRDLRTALLTRNPRGGVCPLTGVLLADVRIVTPDDSTFPGQTAPNGGNFHAEDAWSKLSHICCGALRAEVSS